MSMVERVQSNPFMAGNIKVVPRDRQGEGARENQCEKFIMSRPWWVTHMVGLV